MASRRASWTSSSAGRRSASRASCSRRSTWRTSRRSSCSRARSCPRAADDPRAAAGRPRRAAPQRDGRARRSPRQSLLGRRAGLGPRRALAALYEGSLGRRRPETDRTRRLSGSAVAQSNERVSEAVDLAADLRLAPALRPPALAPRSRPALPVDAALAVAAVEDHLDVDLARKLAREVPVQVQLLAGNDEEVLAHDFLLSDRTPARQMGSQPCEGAAGGAVVPRRPPRVAAAPNGAAVILVVVFVVVAGGPGHWRA